MPALVLGGLLTPEALELLLEGLHLSVNGFDREERCQPRDGRVRRGFREGKGGWAGRMIFVGLGCSRDLGIGYFGGPYWDAGRR